MHPGTTVLDAPVSQLRHRRREAAHVPPITSRGASMASTMRRRLTLAATLTSLTTLAAACGGGSGSGTTGAGQSGASSKASGKVVLKYWDMQWGSPTFMNA